ncbi:uncharacterized protein FPOAC1_013590 [Fusarium poae]|uniref:Uncharacterized protein n=1 Tax=Fusarium poae TaxID=36050 RepID=A0A1B8A8M9_FUSPO|nr:uncharacterized protein FPOAC1_013590 [Fusarium poae]KAG8664810.1 hypothetical protein FPOAC1_013590 [Fusarium poae]OBS16798.1 hypothetical protein FPOA_12607 [Fusarium poae]OBS16809.1 hypothetical protein FPOA_12603 [Fusarium poae]OBS16830.1 hypothetical protein FPOA_12597 [Fusarium poae]OBS17500.1 hypothetical protein FPOA_12039 [Fusarium poae]
MSQKALTLLTLFYKTYNEKVNDWAGERGFTIEKPVFLGSQILLLQSGDVRIQHDRISIVIFIPIPKAIEDNEEIVATDEATTTKTSSARPLEPHYRISIQSLVTGPVFAESSVECEVGDVLVLEGGEQLSLRGDDVCMLCTLHRTNTAGAGTKDNDQM